LLDVITYARTHHNGFVCQVFIAFVAFLAEVVTPHFGHHHLASSTQLETLGCPLMGFHLGHWAAVLLSVAVLTAHDNAPKRFGHGAIQVWEFYHILTVISNPDFKKLRFRSYSHPQHYHANQEDNGWGNPKCIKIVGTDNLRVVPLIKNIELVANFAVTQRITFSRAVTTV